MHVFALLQEMFGLHHRVLHCDVRHTEKFVIMKSSEG